MAGPFLSQWHSLCRRYQAPHGERQSAKMPVTSLGLMTYIYVEEVCRGGGLRANLSGCHICLLGGGSPRLKLGMHPHRLRGESQLLRRARGRVTSGSASWQKALEEACRGANAVVLPLSGTDSKGNVKVTSRPALHNNGTVLCLSPNAICFQEPCRVFWLPSVSSRNSHRRNDSQRRACDPQFHSVGGGAPYSWPCRPRHLPYTNSNCIPSLGWGEPDYPRPHASGHRAHVWVAAAKGKRSGLAPLRWVFRLSAFGEPVLMPSSR